MRTSNVDSVQMCHATIALGDIDVLELAVHVVLGYGRSALIVGRVVGGRMRTFDELTAVGLAGIDLNCDLVTLRDHTLAVALTVSATLLRARQLDSQ